MKPLQIAALSGVTAIAPIALDMYLPAAVSLAASLGAPRSAIASTVSVFLLGLSVGQLVAGPLSDRFGRRPMILGGLFLFALASWAASVTTSFNLLLVARLFQALGACAALSSSRAMVSDLLDAKGAAMVFSRLALVGGAAPVLAPLAGAWLVTMGSWRLNFVAMGVLGVAMLLLSWTALSESRSTASASHARSETAFGAYLALLGNRPFRLYLLAAACNSAAFFSYLGNSPEIYQHVYGLNPTQFSLIFAVNAVALVSATQINRRLLTRMPTLTVLGLSARNAVLLGAAFVLFGLTGFGGVYSLSVLFFLLAGSIAPVQANTMAGGMACDRLRVGTAAALFGTATFAAGALIAWIGARLYDNTAGPLSLLIGAFLVASAGAVFALKRHERRVAAPVA